MQKLKGFLGVDTGGTFTDFYWYSETGARFHKVLSTPEEPQQAVMQGIADLGITAAVREGAVVIIHGSTVATNAALEGRGARTVLVTNLGFGDLLTLGRQDRPDIYALYPVAMKPPVPQSLCVEVNCRRDAQGRIVQALTDRTVQEFRERIAELNPQAVAINLLFSYINSADERRLIDALPDILFACRSSEVLPEICEYERGVATWLNAWLGPVVESYIGRLQKEVSPAPLSIMQSSGGTVDATSASRRAVNLLLSGPAAGLAAAQYIGRQVGQPRLMTFDMGGTSTDVALIDGEIRLTTEGRLAGYPIAAPMVNMHTIGAGGGSLASLDAGGLLHVGPKSAGARPGPACYGYGGRQPTVTDANAVLGRLRPDYFLGGRMVLDLAAAGSAVGRLADELGVSTVDAAQGIIATTNEHMAKALRVISVQQGYKPEDYELCCFGGAGGLHVCALAEELEMDRIIIPANGGVLSALGMLVAPRQRQMSRSIIQLLSGCDLADLRRHFDNLAGQGREALEDEGVSTAITIRESVDCRYSGQSFSLTVPMADNLEQLEQNFHKAHQESFGPRLSLPVELVTIRVQVESPSRLRPNQVPGRFDPGKPVEVQNLPILGEVRVWLRAELALNQIVAGPSIICEEVATTLVAPGWLAKVDDFGNLRLTRCVRKHVQEVSRRAVIR